MKSNMLEFLEETTRRLPDKVSFYDDRESLTYAQLTEKAQRIGSSLAATAPLRTPVALLLESRSIRNVSAMYGTLYAGCAYAPLDIAMPPERLKLLLDLMQPSAVLADEKGARAYEGLGMGFPLLRSVWKLSTAARIILALREVSRRLSMQYSVPLSENETRSQSDISETFILMLPTPA